MNSLKKQDRFNPSDLLPSMQSNFPLHHRRRLPILRSSHTGISKHDSEKHLHCNVPPPFPPISLNLPPSSSSSQDILQSYSYRNFVLQNGTFSLQEESLNGENSIPGCYRCEQRYYRGYTTEECSLRNVSAGVDVPVEVFGYGIWPVGSVVDVCGE